MGVHYENIGIMPYRKSEGEREITTRNGIMPLSMLEVEITLRCPLRCIHCSVRGGEGKIDIPIEKYKEIVDDAEKIGVQTIDIIGGEPLAYRDIYEAIEYSLKKVPNVILSTAGYFVDKKIIKKLKEVGLKEVFISIDGPTAEKHEKIRGKGTFQKTCDAVSRFSDEGFCVTVSFVVTSETYTDIPEMLSLCERLGAKRLFLLNFIPEGRGKAVRNLCLTPEMLKYVMNSLRSYRGQVEVVLDCSLKTDFSDLPEECSICPAGVTFATIKVNGDVFPCGFLREYEFFKAGNIYEERFYDIWVDNKRFRYFRNKLNGCDSCAIYSYCRGGCQAVKRGKACGGKPEIYKKFFSELGFIKSVSA